MMGEGMWNGVCPPRKALYRRAMCERDETPKDMVTTTVGPGESIRAGVVNARHFY